MSLIKAEASELTVRGWRPAEPELRPPPPPEPDRLALAQAVWEQQRLALTAERAQLAEQLQALEGRLPALVAEAEARGREAGAAAAASRAEDALKALQHGLDAAVARVAADHQALEHLACTIARAALGRIFADPEAPATLVESAIRRQLGALQGESLVRIEVSAADFPQVDRLARMTRELGGGRAQVIADSGLRSGDCRLRLTLGEIEIGLPQQWRRLAAVLDAHMAESADAG